MFGFYFGRHKEKEIVIIGEDFNIVGVLDGINTESAEMKRKSNDKYYK